MTPEAQRIAIARVYGITLRDDGSWYRNTSSGTEDGNEFDPLRDLNAMHEAEKALEDCEIKWRAYRDWLYVVCEPHRNVLHATAAQRAKAFLQTLNLWKEDDS